MDPWKFYDITHRNHVVMNPTSEDKINHLVNLLPLQRARVIDLGCGKGEFLLRLAQAYDVAGIGVDISPFCVADAKRNHQERASSANLSFIQADGATTNVDRQTFDMASCLGASWIFGGYRGTLQALISMVKPDGWIVIGEPYWRQESSEDYLKASGDQRDTIGTHAVNADAGEELGLHLVYTFVSSADEVDAYDGLQWYAADEYARMHAEDPDVPESVKRVAEQKRIFLRWGRDTLGWAIYVFRRASASGS